MSNMNSEQRKDETVLMLTLWRHLLKNVDKCVLMKSIVSAYRPASSRKIIPAYSCYTAPGTQSQADMLICISGDKMLAKN